MSNKKVTIISLCLVMAMLLSACGAETAQKVDIPDTTELEKEETSSADEYAGALRISEIMAKNGAVLQCSDGYFYDWIEIENVSEKPVDLTGWSISINGECFEIHNGTVLEQGTRCVAFASGENETGDISVSGKVAPGDNICLVSPMGSSTEPVECFEERENVSLALTEKGVFESCVYPTPGKANTPEEYEALNSEKSTDSPLVISEIMGKNAGIAKSNKGYCDWIELRNVSTSDVLLSDYYLSDKESDPFLFQLPEQILAPGESIIIWCSGNTGYTNRTYIHSNFKISGSGESIYLSTLTGYVDFAAYPSVSTDWSFGRSADGSGWLYFPQPSPGTANSGGYVRMSAQPQAITEPGCYDDVDSLTVELGGNGTVYYTLDGTVPSVYSDVYEGPVEISQTTILRCICVQEGCAPSAERTFSYFINEGHTLPVLSLVADDYDSFKSLYYTTTLENRSQKELPVSLTLYDSGEVFSQKGAVSMKGWTSLELPKKSMGVNFTGDYGDGAVQCDIFNSGVDEYSSLSIRAGQDYTFAVIRNELIQELCLEATDNVPTQHSKYCVLYINGNYWGLYCLKEDISKSYYANLKGVDKSSVVKSKSPIPNGSEAAEEFLQFCINNDLTVKENYDYFCSVFDMDNLIDWIIMEGFSANTDINGNMRYFRTDTGKWQIALYDLDWTLRGYQSGKAPFSSLLGNSAVEIYNDVIKKLMKNEEFCNALYTRAEELFGTVLSNEHVLEKIDEMTSSVEAEIPRDREKWDLNTNSWYMRVNELKSFITDYNWDERCLNVLKEKLKID